MPYFLHQWGSGAKKGERMKKATAPGRAFTVERLKKSRSADCALLLALLLVSCVIMFHDYLFGDQLMIFNDIGSDTWQQYIMNYTSIVNHLRDGSFSLWDFSNGLGVNMFNFNLFDPFLMLLYGIGAVLGPAHMLIYINVIQVMKILAAGLAFYWFLSQFTFSRQAKLAASYVYGLNGFLLVWGQHYQFGTAVVYLPLLLLFCEKLIQGKKGRKLLPVMVFLCGIYSVYFTYMCLAAAGLYLLFRILMIEGLRTKKRVLLFLSGCGQMLLGLGMSLVIFLPMAAVLLNVSSRLDGEGTGFIEWLRNCFTPYSGKFYLSMLKRMFSSNLQNGFGLAKGPQDYVMNYYEDPVLFCSALAVFFNVQFLVILRKADMKKRAKRVLYLVSLLILLAAAFPVGGTVFNYFTKPTQRYTFVLMPAILLVMAWMWDYLRKGGRLNLILLAAVAALMGWAYWEGWQQAGFTEYKRNILILAAAGIVTVLCLLALTLLKSPRQRKVIMGVLGAALAVNMISEGAVNYQARVTMKKTDTPVEAMASESEKYEADRRSEDLETRYRAEMEKPQDFFREMYRTDLQDALNYLEENDGEFYRVEKDYISGTVAMDSSAQGYRGISTYNSVMNGYVKDFVETCVPELFFADENHYTFWNHVEDNRLAAFLGIRYILSGDGEPDGTSWKLLDKVGSLYIHENVLEAETAHFYTAAISEDSLRELCTEETRDQLLEGAIALEDGEEIESMEEFEKLTADSGGGEEAGSASESEEATGKSVNEEGAGSTSGSEEPEGKAGAGEAGNAAEDPSGEEASAASYAVLDAPEKDSRITGTVHAETEGYVLFMIPYEDGWSLAIDGEETELLRGDIGFLACEVPEGDHTLELTFQAPGLKEGAVGSAVCWALFAAWCAAPLWRKRRNSGVSEAGV